MASALLRGVLMLDEDPVVRFIRADLHCGINQPRSWNVVFVLVGCQAFLDIDPALHDQGLVT